MAKQKSGVIYILTNPSFPEYVKIGFATDIEKRLKQLNRSETIPYAFRVHAVYETTNSLTDKELHKLIDTLNPDLRAVETFDGKKRVKEFYAMSKDEAYALLRSIAKISGTEKHLKLMKPEGHEIQDEKKAEEVKNEARRGPLRFSEINIPIGAKLSFSRDKKITVTVVDDRKVEYNGVTTTLSAVAKQLLGTSYDVQGPHFFTYNGELLTNIRDNKQGD